MIELVTILSAGTPQSVVADEAGVTPDAVNKARLRWQRRTGLRVRGIGRGCRHYDPAEILRRLKWLPFRGELTMRLIKRMSREAGFDSHSRRRKSV